MRNPFAAVLHPVEAWRVFAEQIDARTDAEAIAAGLTVEILPSGVHRYRDPRLDQLADHRSTATSPTRPSAGAASGSWSTPTLTCAGWSR
jgi:hypothetical protein